MRMNFDNVKLIDLRKNNLKPKSSVLERVGRDVKSINAERDLGLICNLLPMQW